MRHLLQITVLAIVATLAFPWVNVALAATTGTGSRGGELAEMCTHENYLAQNKSWYWCVGEVDGVIEGVHVGQLYMLGFYLRVYPDLKVKAPTLFCPPDGATRQKAALIVAKYVRNHPGALNDPNIQVDPNAELIIKSLVRAWPCQTNGS